MKIILPLSVTLPRKTKADKVFYLNLNVFRNAHFHILNAAKEKWCSIVFQATPRLGTCDPATLLSGPPYRFTYTAYPSTRRSFDTSNVCSIIDKFTCDALIEYRVIPGDSYKIIPVIVYQFGEVDRENPRVELEIESIVDPRLETVCAIGTETGVGI